MDLSSSLRRGHAMGVLSGIIAACIKGERANYSYTVVLQRRLSRVQ